jgi:hypothetical protein
MVLVDSHRVLRALWYSGASRLVSLFAYGSITLYGGLFQSLLLRLLRHIDVLQPRSIAGLVWADSVSFATTQEIDFSFFSSGYLDVSVHQVPCLNL